MKDMKELLGMVAVGLLLYALVSGITVNGRHYGVRGCDGDRGVVVDTGEPPPAGSSANP